METGPTPGGTDAGGDADAQGEPGTSPTRPKIKRSISFSFDTDEPAHDSPEPPTPAVRRRRPPPLLSPTSPIDSEIGSPLAIRSPMGGTRHPSVPQVSPPDGHSPLATTHDRSLARPTTIPQSPGTPLQIRSRKKTVVIDDPKALPGAAWFTLFFVACHYLILLFLWMSGYYYNSNPAPTALFLIPTFTMGCVTALGLLCLFTSRNKYIRILMAPRTGMLLAVAGLAGGSAWSLMIYGPLHDDFSQAIQFAGCAALVFLYFALVRRRLSFAGVAFAAGFSPSLLPRTRKRGRAHTCAVDLSHALAHMNTSIINIGVTHGKNPRLFVHVRSHVYAGGDAVSRVRSVLIR
eukprot:Tamp_01501.p1 GENE.Tamp_01501~~Tamp_01501.p1  ORF type:complete len:348 (-),score=19.93 Tamp_01501:4257-5300(-)